MTRGFQSSLVAAPNLSGCQGCFLFEHFLFEHTEHLSYFTGSHVQVFPPTWMLWSKLSWLLQRRMVWKGKRKICWWAFVTLEQPTIMNVSHFPGEIISLFSLPRKSCLNNSSVFWYDWQVEPVASSILHIFFFWKRAHLWKLERLFCWHYSKTMIALNWGK